MEVLFTADQTLRRADELVDYLRGPRLWVPRAHYPDFDAWLERSHVQLKSGEKMAVLAISGGRVQGSVVFQRHRGSPRTMEVKNITVRPEVRRRLYASFLLRSAEVAGASDLGCRVCVVDAKAGNSGMARLLTAAGYVAGPAADLYGLGAGPDVLYVKPI